MAEHEVRVGSGRITLLRLYDLAYEIDLKRAGSLWAARAGAPGERGRLTGTPVKAVSFGVPPLALDLGAVTVATTAETLTANAAVRLYDFGIASLALRFSAKDLAWSAFAALANRIDRAAGPTVETPLWDDALRRLRVSLGDSLDRPAKNPVREDYLLAQVDAFDTPMTADEVWARLDLVPLLTGDDRPLSDGARHDLLAHRFSYRPDDLVVLTWDRAFVLEPHGESDVADVLEMANAQLLEIRTYDEMLDEELPRMRDLVEKARSRLNLLASRRYARLARRLYTLVAEVSELTERVDNALQVTEDVYLARVYAAAMDLFRVANVSAAVDRKLAIVRETYTALHSEAAGARAEMLEIAILVLILVEIVLSLLPH